eukprot:284603-Amphidinium_carterae.2
MSHLAVHDAAWDRNPSNECSIAVALVMVLPPCSKAIVSTLVGLHLLVRTLRPNPQEESAAAR